MHTTVRATVTDNYQSILLRQTPVIDVRSESEFSDGSLPWAISIPILDDDERRQVGIRYKQKGSAAAQELGFKLVSNGVKSTRVQRWVDFIREHPQAVLTCWRGALRSEIAQQWLADEQVFVPRVLEGTKGLRRFTLNLFESASIRPWVVLGGRTGLGKTQLLNEFESSIDLEGLAGHRGSAFGSTSEPQPKLINFEHALASSLLKTESKPQVLIEDESYSIGKLGIPHPIYESMQKARIVILNAPIADRVALTYENYVANSNYEKLLSSLAKIQNRLGGLRYREVQQQMQIAFDSDEPTKHYAWIENLLKNYYDPMYDYQLTKKQNRVVFEGSADEVRIFLRKELSLS